MPDPRDGVGASHMDDSSASTAASAEGLETSEASSWPRLWLWR